MNDTVTPASLFPAEQIRLAEISVYNWGTFADCHVARISHDGTLITGETGAGKSSLIDATQLLYLPRNKAVFNTAAAQAARDDRSLLSYVRGKYRHDDAEDGQGYGGFARRHSTASGVRGLFRYGDQIFTLIALFWVSGTTTAQRDISNLYIVADENLPLDEVVNHLRKGDRRTVKLAHKDRPAIAFYDDFESYRIRYQERLYFENPNAPGLLTRALGLKKIEDLTHLIQHFVLDAGTIRETAAAAVRGFRDLEVVHEQLLDTRARAEYLQKLPKLRDNLRASRADVRRLDQQARQALPIYFAREWTRLLSARLASQHTDHTAKRLVVQQTQADKERADLHWESMHEVYLQAGGGAVEKLEAEREAAAVTFKNVTSNAREYVALASTLGLSTTVSAEQFAAAQQVAAAELANEAATKETLLNEIVETGSAKKLAEDDVTTVQRDLAAAQRRRDSAVPEVYANRRNQLAEDLNIPRDRLMFVAELIDVLPEAEEWRGAIERALGGEKLTLAVPEDETARVARWANQNHLGIRFRFQPVTTVAGRPVFRPDSFLHKVSWRDHPYREWAKALLSHGDLRCVETPEECERNPYTLTRQGLIQRKKGDFLKDDRSRIDDDRTWAIGYTNTARLQRLERQLKEQIVLRDAAQRADSAARERQRQFDVRASQLKALQGVVWSEIDVGTAQHSVARLDQALERARASGGALAKAKANLDDARAGRDQAEQVLSEARQSENEVRRALEKSQADLTRYQPIAEGGLSDEALAVAHELAGSRRDEDLDGIEAAERDTALKLEKVLQQVKTQEAESVQHATGIISGFYHSQRWHPIAVDWGPSVDSIDDYVQHHEFIVAKGLPELVTRFGEMLTKHSTQSLAAVNQQMKNERENIADRIQAINDVLKRTEFRKNTYLHLDARPGRYPLNDEYNDKVTRALALATSDDHEARYAALKAAIDILAKATDPVFAGSKENTRLLDPRFQFEFVAKEFEQGNSVHKDIWASSAGKSGGEKESFAGTIVAASLAYVLTPAGSDKPIYCTVFLDEAFSNTSAAYSRRVLKTFRELRLHLNLITPFKNIELARDCARLLVLVRKNEEHNTSHLDEITWEYIDQKQRERAAALGIKVEANA